MRDHERRPALEQAVHVLLDRALGLGVERAGRLVEHQHRRLVVERAGDRDPLRLAAGQPQPGVADAGRVAERQRLDELRRVRDLAPPTARARRPASPRRARCWPRSCRRTGTRPGARTRSGGAARRVVELADVVAVEQHRALGRDEQSGQAPHERRLAGAGAADERDRRARRDVERDVGDHGAVAVAEADPAQAHVAVERLDGAQRPRDPAPAPVRRRPAGGRAGRATIWLSSQTLSRTRDRRRWPAARAR